MKTICKEELERQCVWYEGLLREGRKGVKKKKKKIDEKGVEILCSAKKRKEQEVVALSWTPG